MQVCRRAGPKSKALLLWCKTWADDTEDYHNLYSFLLYIDFANEEIERVTLEVKIMTNLDMKAESILLLLTGYPSSQGYGFFSIVWM